MNPSPFQCNNLDGLMDHNLMQSVTNYCDLLFDIIGKLLLWSNAPVANSHVRRCPF